MPITPQARKALRKAKKRAMRNLLVRNAYKEAIKAVRKVAAGTDAKELLRLAQQKLDKAAKHNIMAKKTASRKLSRLAAEIKKRGSIGSL